MLSKKSVSNVKLLWGDNSMWIGSLWGSDAKLKNVWIPKEGNKK